MVYQTYTQILHQKYVEQVLLVQLQIYQNLLHIFNQYKHQFLHHIKATTKPKNRQNQKIQRLCTLTAVIVVVFVGYRHCSYFNIIIHIFAFAVDIAVGRFGIIITIGVPRSQYIFRAISIVVGVVINSVVIWCCTCGSAVFAAVLDLLFFFANNFLKKIERFFYDTQIYFQIHFQMIFDFHVCGCLLLFASVIATVKRIFCNHE